ncbi:putative lipid II flippase FtsW [Patescibacteria group bacterium]|nr:putative lipid II flippase FtsW [Patescibacteria group bacterium]
MKKRIDYYLLGVVGVLLILGILVLAGVSTSFSQEKFGTTSYFLIHQLLIGVLPGLILGFITYKVHLTFFKKYSGALILAAIISMLAVFIPGVGIISGGAPRWMNLGFATFQPSELLKLSFIIYFSAWLVNPAKREKFIKDKSQIGKSLMDRVKNELRGLIPFIMVLSVIIILLLFQSDMSTLVVFMAVAIVMYWIANTPYWHTLLIILLSSGVGALFIKFFPYRIRRISVWLDSTLEPMGMGYQIKQIMIAIGSGGIFGLGLGESVQKFGYIPQTMADSIFAIYAEELGFIGCLFLIFLYIFLFWRGYLIFKRSKDNFSKFLAIGISFWLCFQGFFNIGAMIGLLPLTGIPLPFISYGGSHLIVELAAIGLLLNVSKNTK